MEKREGFEGQAQHHGNSSRLKPVIGMTRARTACARHGSGGNGCSGLVCTEGGGKDKGIEF
jgi:hypothetical protein